MRNIVLKRLIQSSFTGSSRSNSSLPFLLFSRRNAVSAPSAEVAAETILFPREGPGFSYCLNWALAAKGVIVKDKVFTKSELKQNEATISESLSGFPIHVRGSVVDGGSEISNVQFAKLIKQVTNHLSSIPNIYVHDGALFSSPKLDVKVCVISDSPSAILSLSNVLNESSISSGSHDSCPLTIYVVTSISSSVVGAIGVGPQSNNGLIAADVERSSLVLSGNAFLDASAIKKALVALSDPVVSAQGGEK